MTVSLRSKTQAPKSRIFSKGVKVEIKCFWELGCDPKLMNFPLSYSSSRAMVIRQEAREMTILILELFGSLLSLRSAETILLVERKKQECQKEQNSDSVTITRSFSSRYTVCVDCLLRLPVIIRRIPAQLV